MIILEKLRRFLDKCLCLFCKKTVAPFESASIMKIGGCRATQIS